ncbi:MAG: hypothetical protein WCF84_11065 [Anaerolineae bacterium]
MNRLESSLVQLEQAQLVHRLAEPDLAYLFKHALVQDTAYASLLKRERKRLHRAVGEALERLYADQVDHYAALLAQHYAEAGDDDRTSQYAALAGDVAARLFAPVEARLHYAQALESLTRLPDTAHNRRRRIQTTTQYAIVAFGSEAPYPILTRLMSVQALAQELSTEESDRLLRARLHFWIGRLLVITNRPLDGIRFYEQVLAEAQELKDRELIVVASGEIGLARVRLGHYGKVEALLRPAIAHLEQTENWQQWTYQAAHLAMSFVAQGQVAEGLAEGEQILRHANASNSVSAIAVSNLFLSFIYMLAGETARSLAASGACIELAHQTGELLLVNMAHGFHAWAASRLGQPAVAQESLEKQDETARLLGGQFVLPEQFAAMRAEVVLNEGKFGEAHTLAEQAVELAVPLGGIWGEGLAQRVWAQSLAQSGSPCSDEVEQHFEASLGAFETGVCLVEAARTHVVWGAHCRDCGNRESARRHFEQAAAQFATAHLDRELDETRGLIAALSTTAS